MSARIRLLGSSIMIGAVVAAHVAAAQSSAALDGAVAKLHGVSLGLLLGVGMVLLVRKALKSLAYPLGVAWFSLLMIWDWMAHKGSASSALLMAYAPWLVAGASIPWAAWALADAVRSRGSSLR